MRLWLRDKPLRCGIPREGGHALLVVGNRIGRAAAHGRAAWSARAARRPALDSRDTYHGVDSLMRLISDLMMKLRPRPRSAHGKSGKKRSSGRRDAPSGQRTYLDLGSPWLQGVTTGFVFLIAALACQWAFFVTARGVLKESSDERLIHFAWLAAAKLNFDEHAQLTRPEQLNNEDYLAVVEPLRQMLRIVGDIQTIHTVRKDGNDFRVVVDAARPIDTDQDGLIDQHQLGERYLSPDPKLREAFQAGAARVSSEPYTDDRGSFLSAYVPMRSPDGRIDSVLCVSQNAHKYYSRLEAMRRAMRSGCLTAVLSSVMLALGVAFLQRYRRRVLAALAESQERYELAVDGANEGLWDLDPGTGSLYCSPRFKRMLGFPPDHPIDRFEDLEALIEPNDRDGLQLALTLHLESRQPFDLEFRIRSQGGEPRWYRMRGQAVWSRSGRPKRMAGSLGDINERITLMQELRSAARLDRLTNLPNRAALLDRLQQAISSRGYGSRETYAVLFLDFDRFKLVNDSLGHDVGDQLLCNIAERLRTNLRLTDMAGRICGDQLAARMGGDEFVVLLESISQPSDACQVAQRLIDALSQPHRLGEYQVVSNASIGIVVGTGCYKRAEDVLRDADTAMYEAKQRCKGHYVVFDAAMSRRVRRRLQLEQELRGAIDHEQLRLEYQPIVNVSSGGLASMEALARWEHPSLGPIAPDEFIPIAEECGAIIPLGDWVFQTACTQLRSWWDTYGRESVPSININLSRQQLLVPDLPARLDAAARKAGVEPSAIMLEITESILVRDATTISGLLKELREIGFGIALDDFGVGYSSLSCLYEMPCDVLKIDRSLVAHLGQGSFHEASLQAITTLAAALGFQVVAEGVETETQLQILRRHGCDMVQGYWLGRPAPAEAIVPAEAIPTASSDAELDARPDELIRPFIPNGLSVRAS